MFDGYSCDHCDLTFSNMPQSCYLNELNEPVLSMLPIGSRPLDEEIRQRLPANFLKAGEFYSLRDALCTDCFHKSGLLDGEPACCLKVRQPKCEILLATGKPNMPQVQDWYYSGKS